MFICLLGLHHDNHILLVPRSFSLGVHKDVKTHNIFLTTHQNVKVGDFGSTTTLRSGMTPAIGEMTELFIAPEVFGGAPMINEKVDM